MSSLIKKLFGTLAEKPWEQSQVLIDNKHTGKTFGLSNQMSAVIIIFGVSTAIFSLIFTERSVNFCFVAISNRFNPGSTIPDSTK